MFLYSFCGLDDKTRMQWEDRTLTQRTRMNEPESDWKIVETTDRPRLTEPEENNEQTKD